MTEEYDVFSAFGEGFIFRFAWVERDVFFTSGVCEKGSCIAAYAECVRGVTGGVGVTGVGGVGRGGEGDSIEVVGRDGGERRTEVGVTFKVPEELDLVGTVGGGGVSVFGAKVNDLFAAVVAKWYVEQ